MRGAYGPRLLALTAAEADSWMPPRAYPASDRLAEAVDRPQDAAAAVHDPAGQRKIDIISGRIARTSWRNSPRKSSRLYGPRSPDIRSGHYHSTLKPKANP